MITSFFVYCFLVSKFPHSSFFLFSTNFLLKEPRLFYRFSQSVCLDSAECIFMVSFNGPQSPMYPGRFRELFTFKLCLCNIFFQPDYYLGSAVYHQCISNHPLIIVAKVHLFIWNCKICIRGIMICTVRISKRMKKHFGEVSVSWILWINNLRLKITQKCYVQ